MLNTELTIEIETSKGAPSYLSGKVTEFALLGREATNSPYYLYKTTVRPNLWYLTQGQDSRIFQNTTVPDILKKVFANYTFEVDFQLYEKYRDWEYCVQYQESDFNFVSRLMEHEGMYYYFTHEHDSHTLVVTDAAATHKPSPNYEVLTYFDAPQVILNVDRKFFEYAKAKHSYGNYSGSSYWAKTSQLGVGHSIFGFRRTNGFLQNGRVFMDDYKKAFGKKDGIVSRISFIYEAEREVIKKRKRGF